MSRIGQFFFKTGQRFLDGIFECLCSVCDEDEDDDGEWPVASYPLAKCHICNQEAPGHHPKGEFVVCDDCRSSKPGN